MSSARQQANRGLACVFDRFAARMAAITGTPTAFALAVLTLVGWAVTGPALGFSDTWQLVINTATTIVTFLMVFLIQHTENKHSSALHIKLDELIRSSDARNRFMAIEDLDDKELSLLRERLEREAGERAEERRRTGPQPVVGSSS